jgi:NitT/TauT family transport system ATP-binding protein
MNISIADVTVAYRTKQSEVQALCDIDLEVKAGEFIALVGPSGCGKSTLLKTVAGLLPPVSGTVRIGTEEVTEPRTDIGYMFQSPVLLPWRSVLQNVELQGVLRGADSKQNRERACELLEKVGLGGNESNYVFELSGGMQQRVAFCRAVLHNPNVLLMDEPFGALDALTREQISLDLQQMWLDQGGQTVLFVTHSISEAVLLADRVAVFSPRPGRILEVIDVDLERPREASVMSTAAFGEIADSIRRLIMGDPHVVT